jgi:beta-alanine degradation protein BauB
MSEAWAAVVVDDDRVRVTRWTFSGGATTAEHRHEFDYVVVPITGGSFTVTAADGSVREMVQTAGVAYLGRAGTEHEVANAASVETVFVEIELKS